MIHPLRFLKCSSMKFQKDWTSRVTRNPSNLIKIKNKKPSIVTARFIYNLARITLALIYTALRTLISNRFKNWNTLKRDSATYYQHKKSVKSKLVLKQLRRWIKVSKTVKHMQPNQVHKYVTEPWVYRIAARVAMKNNKHQQRLPKSLQVLITHWNWVLTRHRSSLKTCKKHRRMNQWMKNKIRNKIILKKDRHPTKFPCLKHRVTTLTGFRLNLNKKEWQLRVKK